ncbi:hypothetical protein HUU40_05475 [candidate division KSB1 bacterium]|nr:hypothetical protein [candidate division KSB1 bacterium]
MSLTLTFQIHLRSDYHLSAGHRGEDADSALFRDADGLPVLRGTTVAALLRDGLRRLILTGAGTLKDHVMKCRASGLDENQNPRYCGQDTEEGATKPCPVCEIFGSPKTIKPWLVSSARPMRLQKPEAGNIPSWGAQNAMRVRVDPRTRRAEARKLFSQEEGDSRLVFEFTVTNVRPTDEEEAQAALIVAAARMVRNLGGSRRRGRGECLFLLTNVSGASDNNPAVWLNKFQEIWLKGNAITKPGGTTNQPDSKPILRPATGSRLRLRSMVRADEPILVAKRAEAGNEFEALESIPGTAVRGAFAQMAANALARYSDEMRENFMRLFFSEHVRFSPLYPAAQDRASIRPAFPAPLDFQTCKLHPGFKAYGAGVLKHYQKGEKGCLRCEEAKLKADLKSMHGYLYVDHQSKLKDAEVDQRLEMHNTINPRTERVLTTNLFAYQPLASAQFFMGEIFCADKNLWNLLIDMAGLQPIGQSFTLHLGKASRRGYGKTTAVVQEMPAEGSPLWIGQPIQDRVSLQAELILTLMSDTIVPDCWGRFHTGFEDEWLTKELGTAVKIDKQFVNARDIDSFNAHLGLPRWRDVALTAGSSVLLQPNGQWDLARLEQLEREGLGLRRNEGFGWIAFNHPVYFNPAALEDWQFELHKDLKRANTLDSHRFSREEKFREAWKEALKKSFDKCRKQPFIAAARLLRVEKNSSPSDLKERLNRLGLRENLDETLPPNENLWFDKEGKGKEGRKQILDALDELKNILPNHGEDENHRKELAALGIEMLAERIAKEANQDERRDNR